MAEVSFEDQVKAHPNFSNSYCVYQYSEQHGRKMCCLWVAARRGGGTQLYEEDNTGARERAYERGLRWLNALQPPSTSGSGDHTANC